MNGRPFFGTILLAGASALLAGNAAYAQEKIELRPRFQPGIQWKLQTDSIIQMRNQQSIPGGPSQSFEGQMRETQEAMVEVLETDNGQPSAVRVQFGKCRRTMEAPGQGQQEMPFPFAAGQTVTVRRQAGGAVSLDYDAKFDMNAEVSLVAQLQNLVDAGRGFYPPKPVAVGEAWDGDEQSIKRGMSLKPNDQASMKLKLAGIRDVNGRKAADVEVVTCAIKTEQGMQAQNNAKGRFLIDVATGRLVQIEMEGEMNMSGMQTMQSPDGPMTVNVVSQMRMKQNGRSEFVGNVPAPVPTVPAAPTANTGPQTGPAGGVSDAGGAPPARPSGNGGNPFGREAQSGPFAGTFQNEKMKMEITGGSGQYKGTIHYNGQAMPFTATETDGKLKGTFQTGGQSFPFEAALNDGKLRFNTENITMTLEKQSANPFRQEPQAAPPANNPSGGGGGAQAPVPGPSVASNNQDSSRPARPAAGLLEPYVNEQLGFRVMKPAGWKAEIIEDQYLLVKGGENTDALLWPITLQGESKQMRGVDLGNLIIGAIKQQVRDFQPSNIYESNDKSSLHVIATYTDDTGVKCKGVLSAFVGPGGNGLICGYAAPESEFSQAEPTLRQVVASFQPIAKTRTLEKGGAKEQKLSLQTARTQEGMYTLKIPQGWRVVSGGQGLNIILRAYDPQNPLRQMIYSPEIGPFYVSQVNKNWDMQAAQWGGNASPLAEVPVVDPPNAETVVTAGLPALTRVSLVRQTYPWMPVFESFQVEGQDRQAVPAQLRDAVLANIRNTANTSLGMVNAQMTDASLVTARFQQDGQAGKARLLVLVTRTEFNTGLANDPTVVVQMPNPTYGNLSYFTMISAPQNEFDNLAPTLMEMAKSLQVNQEYVTAYARAYNEANRGNGPKLTDISKTLSETSDIITKGYAERSQTYDRISQKWSDTIRGDARLYDPDTNTVYRVPQTFPEQYNLDPQAWNRANMRELTPREWTTYAPLDGGQHLWRER